MNNLATIQKITEINPIPNADKIEVLSILGWKVVAQKGLYKSSDLCVYIQIDTIVPETPEFEFLRDKHFRIKTIRLRGQISQGIVFPLSVLDSNIVWSIGCDVTDILKVTKYEKQIPINIQGFCKGNFPSYIPKTDEERIQNFPKLLNEFKNKNVYITTKIDGTSATFSNFNGETNICSRNLSIKEDANNIYWKMFRLYHIEEVLGSNKNIAIQGEIAGFGIQQNPLGLDGVEFFVFDVYDIDKAEYYEYEKLRNFCMKNNLNTVPIQNINNFDYTLEQLLELAKGKHENTNNNREGIVIRPIETIYSFILGKRLSCKVINNDYKE